jgi:peptidoglycan hydrolase CwlO-like protein
MNCANFENLPLNMLTLEELTNLYAFVCKRDGNDSAKAKELSSYFRDHNHVIAEYAQYCDNKSIIETLEEENDNLANELKDLSTDIAEQERTIRELNNKLDNYYDSELVFKETIAKLESRVESLIEELDTQL